jgi:hypothetical protein
LFQVNDFIIIMVAAISVAAIIGALRRPGGCLRYPFLCGALYLTWIVPNLVGLSGDVTTPEGGFTWLAIMVVLCLAASLVGWRVGAGRQSSSRATAAIRGRSAIGRMFWPAAGLTALMFVLHALIGLQPVEAREQTQWSGPLTIIAFFLSLAVVSLYLSLLIALQERSIRALLLAGSNVLLTGTTAFIALRRGMIIDCAIAGAAALWFGARRQVPIALLGIAVVGMVLVTYAIVPLRSAAKDIEARTGSSVGLLSPEVWQQVDFADEVQSAAGQAVDLANAAHLIDYANKWGQFTLGQQSWDAFVFRWVPGQLLGSDFKNSLMFKPGSDLAQIEAEYGFKTVGGTTSTGFGFAYQEFWLFGCIYFLVIGAVMGCLWSRAEAGDVEAQTLYATFAGGALLSVTHHAMWLIIMMPLYLLAVYVLKQVSGRGAGLSRLRGRHRIFEG